jgi:predicted O-linked N-acetylglucosamine transferase (SPINDLY family)
VGGAILSAIGMTDWIATDDDQYVQIVSRSTPDRLRIIRRELPDLIDRSCNPAEYTRAVEAAYQTMCHGYYAERRKDRCRNWLGNFDEVRASLRRRQAARL